MIRIYLEPASTPRPVGLGLSGARATIKILFSCVFGKFWVPGIVPSSIAEQSFEGDIQVRTTSHPLSESKGDATGPASARERTSTRYTTGSESVTESASSWANTDRGSATDSTRTRASTKRSASLGMEATLTDREPHDQPPKSRRDTTGFESARESEKAGASAKRNASLGVEATPTDRREPPRKRESCKFHHRSNEWRLC